ncbi:hypothetical protein [Spartinivicinus poritis]|uniref:Uncharacterized protein n=1 Tax=Spartinivicinus poritis TaxID=2994640 RepID=A0ABT5U5M3_9GAMM|nr:hypothetical protein [Spartinivicinus sp. A2-2]MDE1460768.1 hypothetical protein [Spartinivicinus sp. A2-2]
MKTILTSIILISFTATSYAGEPSVPAAAAKTSPAGSSPVVAQDDRIVEMLKKSGKISPDATKEEIQQAVHQYLEKRAKLNQARKNKPPKNSP